MAEIVISPSASDLAAAAEQVNPDAMKLLAGIKDNIASFVSKSPPFLLAMPVLVDEGSKAAPIVPWAFIGVGAILVYGVIRLNVRFGGPHHDTDKTKLEISLGVAHGVKPKLSKPDLGHGKKRNDF